MKSLLSLSIFLVLAATAQAQNKNLKDEFRTLGDNKDVVERVKHLDTHQKVRVVQNRTVDRNNRMELAFDSSYVSGGDTYVQTWTGGAALNYHITPRWSLGVEYKKGFNTLAPEGKRQYDNAYQCQQADPSCAERFVEVDFPLDTKMATISFYPVYGKMNLFDWSIVQFDVYTLLGYGKKTLNSGVTDVYAAGLGAGIWLNKYITTRLEVRYEKYKDLLQSEIRDQNAMSAIASVGILVW